jgi:hypothetical protein
MRSSRLLSTAQAMTAWWIRFASAVVSSFVHAIGDVVFQHALGRVGNAGKSLPAITMGAIAKIFVVSLLTV